MVDDHSLHILIAVVDIALKKTSLCMPLCMVGEYLDPDLYKKTKKKTLSNFMRNKGTRIKVIL